MSTSPFPPVSHVIQRTSVVATGGGYTSPEYPKPPTPYEDKVIPTLRNRNRGDGGNLPGSSMTNNDVGKRNNDDLESVSGAVSTTLNEDATAELNQAEIIEANQMMIVFDKNLVRNPFHLLHQHMFFFRLVNYIIEIMCNVKKR